MAAITELQGALIADLVYDDLSSKINQPGQTQDDGGNIYTTLDFFLDTTSDLQMALLVDTDGRKIVAFRGTEPASYLT